MLRSRPPGVVEPDLHLRKQLLHKDFRPFLNIATHFLAVLARHQRLVDCNERGYCPARPPRLEVVRLRTKRSCKLQEERFEPDEQFWEDLARHGAADPKLVDEYRRIVTERPWKPIGRILLEQGTLSTKQVAGLLQMQADEPNLRLGDLAIREESCSVAEIEEALRLQRDSCPGPIELMLDDRRINQRSLLSALVGYIRHLEGTVHRLREKEMNAV